MEGESSGEVEGRLAEEEYVIRGVGVAPGIAIGSAYVYASGGGKVTRRELADENIEEEIERFKEAVERAERELDMVISMTRQKLGEDSAGIFEAQRMMLRDEALFDEVLEHVRKEGCNAGYAVKQTMKEHRRRLEAGTSEYLRERANDLTDVQDRLIRHLRRKQMLSDVEEGTIVIAEKLSAADIMLFSQRQMPGFATDHGGATSHVSIIARALGVPTVAGLGKASDVIESGDTVVLDGIRGEVVVRPSEEHLRHYRSRQRRYRRKQAEERHQAGLPAETQDGHAVTLRANVEFNEEVDLLKECGADGIGLFRTEVLLMMRGDVSVTEEGNFRTYKEVVERVAPASTTLRLLDLGGDKLLPLAHREHNPFLGWRGIRVLLDKPDVLRAQLRAVLRASAFGPVRILVPMVTHLDELHKVREAVALVQEELAGEGTDFDPDVPIGIMVEVPAVALRADAFADAADFFSIGTNDLTQYLLATDRGNDLVAHEYSEFHPAVLSLIKTTVEAGHRAGIPVSLCGEMGGDARAAPLLVGLGLDELSASPTYLPEIKRVIRSIRRSEAEDLAESALAARSIVDVTNLVDAWMQAHAAEVMQMLEPDA